MQQKLAEHDNNILLIFAHIKQLEESKQQEIEFRERKQVGYKRTDK